MNKVELVSSVQKTLGTNKADAERAVNAVIDGIKAGDQVILSPGNMTDGEKVVVRP